MLRCCEEAKYLGELPESWSAIALENIVKKEFPIVYGIVQAGPHIPDGIPYIRSCDVGGRLNSSSLLRTSAKIAVKYKRSKVVTGDIVFSLRGNIGESSIVPSDLDGANLTQGTARISVSSKYSSDYIRHALKGPNVSLRISSVAKGSTFKEISLEELRRTHIPVPPLKEQQRIAKVLDAWDTSIGQIEKLIGGKEHLKRALIQQLLSGRLRHSEYKPSKWVKRRMGELLEEVSRPVLFNDMAEYPLISIRRRSGGLFHRETLQGTAIKTKSLFVANEGDFLISRRQVVHGAMALTTKEFDGMYISGEYTSLITKDPEVLDIRFFDLLSRTKELWHAAYLASKGVHIEKLIFNTALFLKEEICIPPSVEEQLRIVEVITGQDKEIEMLKKHLSRLRLQKQGLMQQLLTGKIRVAIND